MQLPSSATLVRFLLASASIQRLIFGQSARQKIKKHWLACSGKRVVWQFAITFSSHKKFFKVSIKNKNIKKIIRKMTDFGTLRN
jgi:hypothetical protein